MATSVQVLNDADKTKRYAVAVGTGAPANGDALVDLNKFPVGSTYTNTAASGGIYGRQGVAGTAADWLRLDNVA